jgi:aminoglycoside phosphotransferase (APT) family kinase protein
MVCGSTGVAAEPGEKLGASPRVVVVRDGSVRWIVQRVVGGCVAGRMHTDEVEVTDRLVRQLVDSHFPEFRDLDLQRLDSAGTVNAMFRLGSELCVRLPINPGCAGDLDKELLWLDRLRPQLPLDIPEPVATGSPALGYPFRWAVYRWLDGVPYSEELVEDEAEAAQGLATFVRALQRNDTSGAPASGRLPLKDLDAPTRWAIEAVDWQDPMVVAAAWERALAAPAWDEGMPVWRHCDLLPPNLLVDNGRLTAVIDFGGVGVGDPAADAIAAWTVFGSRGRARFREALGTDDGTWDRARGLALHQALLITRYYSTSNPGFAAMARRTVREVLDDLGLV